LRRRDGVSGWRSTNFLNSNVNNLPSFILSTSPSSVSNGVSNSSQYTMPKATSSSRNKPAKGSNNRPGKLIPINFSNCLASRPAHTSDDWLDEGNAQESSAERYQFGKKAENHYQQSILCFAAAASCDPTSFSALYNSARVRLGLCSDFLKKKEAFEANVKAVDEFNKASLLASDNVDKADSLFNYAVALIELYDRIEDGILDGTVAEEALIEKWGKSNLEAKVVLEHVIVMQRLELSDSSVTDSDEMGGDDIKMSTEERAALMERRTTPESLLESLLAYLSLLITLNNSTDDDFLPLIHATINDASTLHDQLIEPTSTLELRLLQLQIMSLQSDVESKHADIDNGYKALMAEGSYSKHIELISQYSDWLFEEAGSTVSDKMEQYIKNSRDGYQLAYKLIMDPFGSKGGLLKHALPVLACTNRISASSVELLDHVMKGGAADVTRWESSWTECIKAVDSLGIMKFTLRPVGDSHSMGNWTECPSPRLDWSTQLAFINSVLQLARVALFLPEGKIDGLSTFDRCGLAVQVLNGLRMEKTDLKKVIDRFILEIKGDALYVLSVGTEEQLWDQSMQIGFASEANESILE
jgi:hypothetical protein